MSYFLPSFFQKRILRYALSRLDLVDTDALDLDRLNIGWGQRSTVELNDVGLYTWKLRKLLKLPRSLTIDSAHILSLRITIPADLYKSGILVEVRGVRVRLDADFEEQELGQDIHSKAGRFLRDDSLKVGNADKPRSTQSQVHDPGGLKTRSSSSPSEELPTSVDLATSFLQTEPTEEKATLQASITDSVTRDESLAVSEADEFGLGNNLALPAFLADFLKGVGDRLRFELGDVQVDLTLKADRTANNHSGSENADQPESVTFRLSIQDLVIEGETETRHGPDDHRWSDPAVQKVRQVICSDLRIGVISEASFFADLASSSVPSSPATNHRNTASRESGTPRHSSSSHYPMPDSGFDTSKASESSEDRGHPLDQYDHKSKGPIDGSIYDKDGSTLLEHVSDDLQASDNEVVASLDPSGEVPYDGLELAQDALERSNVQSTTLASAPVDPVGQVDTVRLSTALNPKHDSMHSNQDTSPASFEWFDPALAAKQPKERYHVRSSQFQQQRSSTSASNLDLFNQTLNHPSWLDSNASPDPEELAESRIFTHEEASMYMSAIGDAHGNPNVEDMPLPGGWDSSGSDTGQEQISTAGSPSNLSRQDEQAIARSSMLDKEPDNSQSDQDLYDQIREGSHNHPRETSMAFPPFGVPLKDDSSTSRATEASSTTSKTPFAVVKWIMRVDNITVTLPRDSESPQLPPEPTKQGFGSTRQEVPGAFSQASEGLMAHLPPTASKTPDSGGASNSILPYSVDIGELQILGDMGLTKLTVLLTQRWSAMRRTQILETDGRRTSGSLTRPEIGLRLSMRKACWKFLDKVEALPLLDNRYQCEDVGTTNIPKESEVLLRASIENLCATHGVLDASRTTKVSMGHVDFGYCSDNIISFDANLKLRESTRDILAPIDSDIVLTVTQGRNIVNVDLTTLPVHVALDLRRLDETFGWFGGFSSILDLGNSMMSTITVTDMKTKATRPRRSARVVHFDTQESGKPPRSRSGRTQSKVTARIGGFKLDLQGTQSSLHLESTAMKVVSRAEGLGLQIDRLKITGPYLAHESSKPSCTVQLLNLRVEYLSTPKEVDLARLLALLCPSKDRQPSNDDILLDTLLRQRRQGGVVRATIDRLEGDVSELGDLRYFPLLAEDLKKLSTVTKYLPEDDRPGILILGLIKDIQFRITINDALGVIYLEAKNVEEAYVTFPALMAVGIGYLRCRRHDKEELLGPAFPSEAAQERSSPCILVRFIGNEMEPTAKIQIQNLRLEYHVSTIIAILGLNNGPGAEAIITEMVSSITTVHGYPASDTSPPISAKRTVVSAETSAASSKRLKLDISVRDSIIGLNPRNTPAKGLFVLTHVHLLISRPKVEEVRALLEIRKTSIMVIDDINNIGVFLDESPGESFHGPSNQIERLLAQGYVSVGVVSAAKATMQLKDAVTGCDRSVDVEIRDDLLVLETCADSTQTLQRVINGLMPPTPPSTERKYMTELVPIDDMLASFTGDAFATTDVHDSQQQGLDMEEGDMMEDEAPQDMEFVSNFYEPEPDAAYDGIANSMLDDDLESLASPSSTRKIGSKTTLEGLESQLQIDSQNNRLDFREDHFGVSSTGGASPDHVDVKRNHSKWTKDYKIHGIPLQIRVRDVHVIWNLFDGYDWQNTRDAINQAVEDVQKKATERMSWKDRRKSADTDEEEDSVIGDFLFNSIYIGVPANRDPRELRHQVNRDLDDVVSETGSRATSTSSGSPNREGRGPRHKEKKLRLKRSRYHKMTFELKGVSADMVVLAPGSSETQSSMDIRIQDLEIFDHVPTSTWKKFATYMHDAGERQSGTSMIHLEIRTVKPVPHLAASEVILKATILPLRLHVDQDALDFVTRFFEFKDDTNQSPVARSEPPFFQRVEVNSVQVKLDFKPKHVDYAGIRSGHTTEFMNFFILDRADMVLRHVIIYGVSGVEKLGKTLNDIWMPDIKRNQLPGILAGIAPVRSLANVGGGVRDLIVVPIREYQKDGRVVRSFQKSAVAFAKTTTSELVKLGAKLAIGTQTVLQGAEDLLAQPSAGRGDISRGWEDTELDEAEKEQISKYADQPVGVMQGLRGAYASLERDLLLAKDAIIAMPGEVLESGTAGGAAKAVLRGAPVVILRPAMGVTKAVGQTLLGATNSLDPGNRRRIEDKYKRH